MIAAMAEAAPVLAADDTGAFMSKVAHILRPNKKNEPPEQPPSPSR
jgi:hypothetical protein